MLFEIGNLTVKASFHLTQFIFDVSQVGISLVIAHIQPGNIIQCHGNITRHPGVQLGEILSLTHIVP